MAHKLSASELAIFAHDTAAYLYKTYPILAEQNVIFINRYERDRTPNNNMTHGTIFSSDTAQNVTYTNLFNKSANLNLHQDGARSSTRNQMNDIYVITEQGQESPIWGDLNNFYNFTGYKAYQADDPKFNEMIEFMIIAHEFGHALSYIHPETQGEILNWSQNQREIFADTFAILNLAQAYPDKALDMLNFWIDQRDLGFILGEDAEHLTSPALLDLKQMILNGAHLDMDHETYITTAKSMAQKHAIDWDQNTQLATGFYKHFKALAEVTPARLVETVRKIGRNTSNAGIKEYSLKYMNIMQRCNSSSDLYHGDLNQAIQDIAENDLSPTWRLRKYFNTGTKVEPQLRNKRFSSDTYLMA